MPHDDETFETTVQPLKTPAESYSTATLPEPSPPLEAHAENPPARPQPVEAHAENPPARPQPATTSRFPWVLTALNLALLLASLGLIGYLISVQRKDLTAEKPAEEDAKKAAKATDEMKPEIDQLKDQIKELAKRLDDRPAPFDPASLLKKIDDRMSDVGKSSADALEKVDALAKRLDGDALASSPPFQAIQKRIGEVDAALQVVKAEAAASNPSIAVTEDDMSRGIALFNQGKYADAKVSFDRLQATSSDDARVWYFAALANGLATRDWKGDSERLVADGMAREKAGKPDRAKIDAAFAGLTKVNGKDWLAYYRNRAVAQP